MKTAEVTYATKMATLEDIVAHLDDCNNSFLPPLSERVNIREYSHKIFEKAVTFEAWASNSLIGLVAVYFNSTPERIAYITDVSVSSAFLRSGIASTLLTHCVEHAVKKGAREMKLEVNQSSGSAIALYEKFGFVADGTEHGFLKMKLILHST